MVKVCTGCPIALLIIGMVEYVIMQGMWTPGMEHGQPCRFPPVMYLRAHRGRPVRVQGLATAR
jgi:hypothetical protein